MQTVKAFRQTLTLTSDKHIQLIDVSKQIRDIVVGADVHEGILAANSLHTTCALFVNEFQGALVEDLIAMMARLVPDGAAYKHDDPRYSDCERGNATAHLRAALLGRSVVVGISGGELSLGRFQSIVFAELDGPRSRGVDVQIVGA
jgi:secondary thiamine-phosphate synthase enzyme